jgi:hypothetical protein
MVYLTYKYDLSTFLISKEIKTTFYKSERKTIERN